MLPRTLSACATIAVVTLGAADLSAQVPDGSFVASSMRSPQFAGPGGLWLVEPRGAVAPVPVLGLSPALVGVPSNATHGAAAAAIRPDDGALWVGERVRGLGDPVHLHEISLAGTTVVRDTQILVGTAAFGGSPGIAEVALLPDGDALVAVQDLQVGPPLQGAVLAIVDRAGGVTPVPTPILDHPNILALAVSPDGSNAYVVVAPIQPHAVSMHEIPLPAGGSARRVAFFTPIVTGLAFDSLGNLIATSNNALHRVDVATGTLTTFAALPAGFANSLAVEPATGGLAVTMTDFAASSSRVEFRTSGGATAPIAAGLTGLVSDLALLPNPRTYGTGTVGHARYDWQVAPSPGGLPQAGTGFGLRVTASGGPLTAGAILASFGAGDVAVLGVRFLLDPANSFWIGTTDATGSLPLPIPANAPIGATLFVQSFHLDAGATSGVATTPGQRLQILR